MIRPEHPDEHDAGCGFRPGADLGVLDCVGLRGEQLRSVRAARGAD